MSEAPTTLSDLRERYSEAEKRFGTVFLSLLFVSLLYWLSFALFLQDPQRTLVPDARRFIEAVDQLETDQQVFKAQYHAKVFQALDRGEAFLEAFRRGPANPLRDAAKLDMDAQLRLQDRKLLGLINQSHSTDFESLLRAWLDQIRSFTDNRIVHEPDILALYNVYFALNQDAGWAKRAAKAAGLVDSVVALIPDEVDGPAWSELSVAGVGLLYQDYDSFESAMSDLQTFYQGPVTDRMQTKTLLGTGVWLRNLDSARQIARNIANTEPTIRLPLVGENVTGRLAFLFAPLLYLVMVRYLFVILDETRHLRGEIEMEEALQSPSEQVVGGNEPAFRKGTHPHMIELLSAWLARRATRSPFDLVVNHAIVVTLFLLPVSTAVPVAIVNLAIFTGVWKVVALVLLVGYGLPLLDTIRLARAYLVNS